MKKSIITLGLCLLVVSTVFAQKVITRTGEIKFEASMPALEEVAATSQTVSCVLDESKGEFASLALIKSFKFKVPLMEEHFNENYMESSKFPKSTFKGKIANFDAKKLSSTPTAYDIDGDLTIHGVTKKIKSKINLSTKGGKVIAATNFLVKPQDYKIEIPSVVKSKIAQNVNISANFELEAGK